MHSSSKNMEMDAVQPIDQKFLQDLQQHAKKGFDTEQFMSYIHQFEQFPQQNATVALWTAKTNLGESALLPIQKEIKIICLAANELLRQKKYAEAIHKFETAMTLAEQLPPKKNKEKLAIHQDLARLYVLNKQFKSAIQQYEQAIKLCRKYHLNEYLGQLFYHIGSIFHVQNKWKQAFSNYQKATDYLPEKANIQGNVYRQLGIVCRKQQQYTVALNYYRQAIGWNQKTTNKAGMGNNYHDMGIVYQQRKDWIAALEHYKMALEWNQKNKQEKYLCKSYHQLGQLFHEQENWKEALKYYEQALEWAKKTRTCHLGCTYHQMALLFQQQNQSEQALEYFQYALEWHEKMKDAEGMGSSHDYLGRAYQEAKQYEKALKHYQKAFDAYEQADLWEAAAKVHQRIGSIWAFNQRHKAAVESYEQAIEYFEQTESWGNVANTHKCIAEIYQQQGNEDELAIENYLRAVEIYAKVEQQLEIADCYCLIAQIYRTHQEWGMAEENFKAALFHATEAGDENLVYFISDSIELLSKEQEEQIIAQKVSAPSSEKQGLWDKWMSWWK